MTLAPVPLEFWGRPVQEVLPWEWAQERLEASETYWLVTVGATGRPAARPVWGVWLDDELLLSVGSVVHGKNLRAGNREVTVHLGDHLEVIVVDGTARNEQDSATLRRFCDVYNPKYAWSFTPETTGMVTAVAPRRVTAWTTVPAAESDPEMQFPSAAGRWSGV